MAKQIIYPDVYLQVQQDRADRAGRLAQEELKETPLATKEIATTATTNKVITKESK